jgi:hypothetical protein
LLTEAAAFGGALVLTRPPGLDDGAGASRAGARAETLARPVCFDYRETSSSLYNDRERLARPASFDPPEFDLPTNPRRGESHELAAPFASSLLAGSGPGGCWQYVDGREPEMRVRGQ